MELQEYIAIRRAFNQCRKQLSPGMRVTFEELALIAHLSKSTSPQGVCTSDLATYQNVLRPTMTHRTNHLHALGYIERTIGCQDRRNVVCTLSEQGRAMLKHTLSEMCRAIHATDLSTHFTSRRLTTYLDRIGPLNINASMFTLIALDTMGGTADSLNDLVSQVGLVQPTVSMSIATHERHGLVTRSTGGTDRNISVSITEAGREAIKGFCEQIKNISMSRSRQ